MDARFKAAEFQTPAEAGLKGLFQDAMGSNGRRVTEILLSPANCRPIVWLLWPIEAQPPLFRSPYVYLSCLLRRSEICNDHIVATAAIGFLLCHEVKRLVGKCSLGCAFPSNSLCLYKPYRVTQCLQALNVKVRANRHRIRLGTQNCVTHFAQGNDESFPLNIGQCFIVLQSRYLASQGIVKFYRIPIQRRSSHSASLCVLCDIRWRPRTRGTRIVLVHC